MRKVVPVEPSLGMIVERIVDTFCPERLVLFGSRARGDHRPDSDVDLLVVMESPLSATERAAMIHRLFLVRRWGMDVFVYTPEEARIARGWRNSLITIAERDGKVLNDKPRS